MLRPQNNGVQSKRNRQPAKLFQAAEHLRSQRKSYIKLKKNPNYKDVCLFNKGKKRLQNWPKNEVVPIEDYHEPEKFKDDWENIQTMSERQTRSGKIFRAEQPIMENRALGIPMVIENRDTSGTHNSVICSNPTIKYNTGSKEFSLDVKEFDRIVAPRVNMETIGRLYAQRYLNSDILNFMMSVYASTSITRAELDSIFLAPTEFFDCFRIMKVEQVNGEAQQTQVCAPFQRGVIEAIETKISRRNENQKRLRSINFFSKKLITFVAKVTGHWMLCLIVNPGGSLVLESDPVNKKKCQIVLFNSINGRDEDEARRRTVEETVRIWLQKEHNLKRESLGIPGEFVEGRIELKEPQNIPLQAEEDEFNCGVFSLVYFKEIFANLKKFLEVEDYANVDFSSKWPGAKIELSDIKRARSNIFAKFHSYLDEEKKNEMNFKSLRAHIPLEERHYMN